MSSNLLPLLIFFSSDARQQQPKMAFSLHTSIYLQTLQSSRTNRRLYPVYLSPSSLLLPHHTLATSYAAAFFRSRNHGSTITSSSSNKKQKNLSNKEARKEEDEIDEDAVDSLFNMLEEDLENDELSIGQGNDDENDDDDDDYDDISEEDLEKLQSELQEAFGVGGDDDADVRIRNSAEDEVENGDGDEEEEKRPVVLKNWQLRRLARALKTGRRKISIKSLAGEVCLDRAYVLDLLRDPPPNLVMMSAALPDEPAPRVVMPNTKPIEIVPEETTSVDALKSESDVKVPVHEMRHSWMAQKRLKKVQVDTLERVYRKAKRPTNTMISSIVHVTNLPRKRVVKWFEDKRAEDGVPAHRGPYQRLE